MAKKNTIPGSLPCDTECEPEVILESMRESQRLAIQQLHELKTEANMENLDGFYGLIKEQENK